MKNFYLFNNRFLSHVIFWLGILFIYTFFPFLHQGHFLEILKTNLFYLPQDIIAVYFVLYVLFPKYLTKFKIFRFTIFSLLIILLLTALSIVVTFYVLPYFNLAVPDIELKKQFSNSLFALLTITALAATIKYVRLTLISQFRAADISMKQMETELKYLRSQINPHFLFNSLNNIDELIFIDKEKASKAIFHLSEILRYVLQQSESNKVSLTQEIDFIKNYIEFASYSFKSKDFIKLIIKGEYNNLQIPPLLFLPLIENAVKYVDRKIKPPGITITFNIDQDFIEFEVSSYYSNSTKNKTLSGIGLKNLKRRLKLIYPDNYALEINNYDGQFIVNLKIFLL